MQTQNVVCNSGVVLCCVNVSDDKNTVESWQDCCLKLDLLSNVFDIRHTTMNWISCGQNWCSWVQSGCDTCFGDWNCLLFHGFVDGHSVLCPHFIKFINAHDTAISKNQGTSFNLKLSGRNVLRDWRSKTSSWRTLTTGIHSNRGSLFNKF